MEALGEPGGHVGFVAFAGGEFRDLAGIAHRAAIVTDFELRDRDGNGRPDIAYGLADGTLVDLLR